MSTEPEMWPLDVSGLKMAPVWINLTTASYKALFVLTALCALSRKKSSFNSLEGAILSKVKDVLLRTNRVKSLYFSAPKCRGLYSTNNNIHTHTTAPIPHHNTRACVWLIPVIVQWTSLWSSKLISHHFIWLTTVRERWAVRVCSFVCTIVCVLSVELCSCYSPTIS